MSLPTEVRDLCLAAIEARRQAYGDHGPGPERDALLEEGARLDREAGRLHDQIIQAGEGKR